MDADTERRAVEIVSDALAEARPIIEQRYTRALNGIRHRFDVDDLYQSVCMRAVRSASRCQGRSPLEVRNWVLKIAANVFRSAIATHKLSAKRSTTRERCTVGAGGDEPHVEPFAEPAEAMRMIVGEQCRQMLNCIDRLSQSRQQILVMRYLEQRSYAQIAEELGVTIQAGRTSVSQAIRQVRTEWHQPNLPGFE